jgi:hypothetical protein
MMFSSIGGINLLPEKEKRAMYARFIPHELIERFGITNLDELFDLQGRAGSTDVEFSLYHQKGFSDPVFYTHLTDTISGQIHVLLYILNDPDAPRFDVDRMSDGSPTKFGIFKRNHEAEISALKAGLAPGQVRRGLRMLPAAIHSFETFIAGLGHEIYFVEPLYYHNAIIFERYGFRYQAGGKWMKEIDAYFQPDGALTKRLDGSNPFRDPSAANSIRLRSWAIHDGIMGEPFTNVTMYKTAGKHAGVQTSDCAW